MEESGRFEGTGHRPGKAWSAPHTAGGSQGGRNGPRPPAGPQLRRNPLPAMPSRPPLPVSRAERAAFPLASAALRQVGCRIVGGRIVSVGTRGFLPDRFVAEMTEDELDSGNRRVRSSPGQGGGADNWCCPALQRPAPWLHQQPTIARIVRRNQCCHAVALRHRSQSEEYVARQALAGRQPAAVPLPSARALPAGRPRHVRAPDAGRGAGCGASVARVRAGRSAYYRTGWPRTVLARWPRSSRLFALPSRDSRHSG